MKPTIEAGVRPHVRPPSHRPSRRGASALLGAAVTAGLLVSLGTEANGGDGTPPPYRCAKTFVAGMDVTSFGGDTLALDILMDSAHFLSLVPSPGSSCPTPPHSLQITGTVDCGGNITPVNQGPFNITPGFSDLGPLGIASLFPSPPRSTACTVTLDFVVTLSDGTQLKRTLTDATYVPRFTSESNLGGGDLTAGGPSPLQLERVGDLLVRVHPGDQALLSFNATNPDPTESVSGTVTVTSRNVALLPEVPVGQNDRSIGAFSLADPEGGDTPPVAVSGTSFGGCLPLPAMPFQQKEILVQRPISLSPGGTELISCDARTYPLCPSGTMAEIDIRIDGQYSCGATAGAATGAVLAVDHLITPQFAWPGAGRMCTYQSGSNPSGPAVGIRGDASTAGTEPWVVNIGADRPNIVYLANGVPPSSGTFNFSGPTYVLNGLGGRYVSEISFITPRTPDTATITFNVPFDVLPSSTSPNPIGVQLVSLSLVPGAPNGYANQYPILMGRLHVMTKEGIADAVLDFQHQISAVGVVDGTFAFDPMENLSVTATIQGPTRYMLATTWRKMFGSQSNNPGQSEDLAQYVGFSMTNDFRGFAQHAAPFVSVGGPTPAIAAIRLFAQPNPASRWASFRFSGPVETPASASIALFDATGRRVRDLATDAAGESRWDLRDERGSSVASGVYFLRAERGGKTLAEGRLQVVR